MKSYLIHAALKQGLSIETEVTALSDGANNCWTVLKELEKHCASVECILDWFHIGMKFQNLKNSLGKSFEKSLDAVKWKLWHGKPKEALIKLAIIRDNITDEERKSKVVSLYNYINRNRQYIVNYEQREQANQTYTSQVAESHVESLINDRQKRSKKMQWTRKKSTSSFTN